MTEKTQIKQLDGLVLSLAMAAIAISLINLYSINRVSNEQASRTKKVYEVESLANRISDLERLSSVHHEKLAKRSIWMEGVQDGIIRNTRDRFTMSDFQDFLAVLKKRNPRLDVPKQEPKPDRTNYFPKLPVDQ